MNPLIAQLLGETPYPLPATARGPIVRDLFCNHCGREDLTSEDFRRKSNGRLETKCLDCCRKSYREKGLAHRLAKKAAQAAKAGAAAVGNTAARLATRFHVWALAQQYQDQTKLLSMVQDVDTYCAMLKGWSATGRELTTARRRLADLRAASQA